VKTYALLGFLLLASQPAMAASLSGNSTSQWVILWAMLILVSGSLAITARPWLRLSGVVAGILAGLLLGQSGLGKFAFGTENYQLVHTVTGWIAWVLMFQSGTHFRFAVVKERWQEACIGVWVFLIGATLSTLLVRSFIAMFPVVSPTEHFWVFSVLVGIPMGMGAVVVINSTYQEKRVITTPWAITNIASLGLNEFAGLLAFSIAINLALQSGNGGALQSILTCVAIALATVFALCGRKLAASAVDALAQRNKNEQAALIGVLTGLALLCGLAAERIGINGMLGAFLFGVLISEAEGLRERTKKALEVSDAGRWIPFYFGAIMLGVDLWSDPGLSLLVLTLIAAGALRLSIPRSMRLATIALVAILGVLEYRSAETIEFAYIGLAVLVLGGSWAIKSGVTWWFSRKLGRSHSLFNRLSNAPFGVAQMVFAYQAVSLGFFDGEMLVVFALAVTTLNIVIGTRLDRFLRTHLKPGTFSCHHPKDSEFRTAESQVHLLDLVFTWLATRRPELKLNPISLRNNALRIRHIDQFEIGAGWWMPIAEYEGDENIYVLFRIPEHLASTFNAYDGVPVSCALLHLAPRNISNNADERFFNKQRLYDALGRGLLKPMMDEGVSKELVKDVIAAVIATEDPKDLEANIAATLSQPRLAADKEAVERIQGGG
jgi:Kef-type K+ transport system membrane component KefB